MGAGDATSVPVKGSGDSGSRGLALVTGGAGFLGRYVARELARGGWEVVGMDRVGVGPGQAKPWGFSHWVTSEINLSSLRRVLRAHRGVSVVFHGAGGASVGRSWTRPLRDFCDGVVATELLIEALRRTAPEAVLVYPSSAAVYGNTAHGVLHEDGACAPVSPYGVHKLASEGLCLGARSAYGLRTVVVRFFSLYGALLRKQLLWDLVGKVLTPGPTLTLGGSGEELRDFLHAEDAGRLVRLVAESEHAAVGVVNGASGVATSVRRVAELVCEAAGAQKQVHFSGVVRHGDPICLVADVRRARELGFAPERDFAGGVRDFVGWATAERGASPQLGPPGQA